MCTAQPLSLLTWRELQRVFEVHQRSVKVLAVHQRLHVAGHVARGS